MKEKRIRKGLIIWIVLALLSAMVVITVPMNVSAAGPWYVNYDTGLDTNPGTMGSPFKTITKALSVAGNNEVINVAYSPIFGPYPGIYTITQTGLSLIGTGTAKPRLDGGSGGNVVTIQADNVIVKKFTIKNSGSSNSGIKITGATGTQISCDISDNEIKNNGNGMYLYCTDSSTIKNNEIHTCNTNGIYLKDDCDSNTFDSNKINNTLNAGIYFDKFNGGNTIKNCEIYNSKYGIYTKSSGDTIKDNEIYNNDEHGIYLYKTSGIDILNNDDDLNSDGKPGIHDNGKDGIFFKESGGTSYIKGNEIHSNGENGIHSDYSCYIEIIKDSTSGKINKIYDNTNDGILLEDSEAIWIEENKIYNTDTAQDYGIRVTTGSQCVYIQNSNEIYSNQKDGIYLEESVGNSKILGNIIRNNVENGIHLISFYSGTLDIDQYSGTGNDIKENSKNGIYIESSTGTYMNYIKGNNIHKNGENGIYLLDSNNQNISNNNQIYNNMLDGILLENADENIIDGNSIFNIETLDQDNGIHLIKGTLYDCSDNDIQNNIIYKNNNNGIYINKCTSTNYILTNTIYENNDNGIRLEETDNQEIKNINNIYSNQDDGILLEGSGANIITGNKINNLEGKEYQNNGVHLKKDSTEGISGYNYIYSNSKINNNNNNGIFIEESSNNNYIHGNTIKNNVKHGIYIKESSNNYITKYLTPNVIESNSEHGIKIDSCTSVNYIEENEIKLNSKDGIHLINSNNQMISNQNMIFGNIENGIKLDTSHSNTIQYNGIYENREKGIYLDNSNENTILGNNRYAYAGCGIYKNYDHGIYLDDSDENTIQSNTIYNNNYDDHNSGDGIRMISNSDSNQIKGNIIENKLDEPGIKDQQYGIYIDSSDSNDITNTNHILSNKKDGIYMTNYCSGRYITNNVILNNNENGIYLNGCASVTIQSNDIGDNGIHGVYLLDSGTSSETKNIICSNQIGTNNEHGIHLESSDYNDIIDNYIIGHTSTSKAGIFLLDSNNNYIESNECYNNYHGIYLEGSDSNTLIDNDIHGNSNYGIYLFNSDSNTIDSNDVYQNNYGIYLHGDISDGSDENTITYNWIYANTYYGVKICLYSDNNDIDHNDFFDNNAGAGAQAYDDGYNNNWDDGAEGNYWNDYESRYPEATNDGTIWDTPYQLDRIEPGNVYDNYPLVYPVN